MFCHFLGGKLPYDYLVISLKTLTFAQQKRDRYGGCIDLIGVLFKIKSKTEKNSFANGGPRPSG